MLEIPLLLSVALLIFTVILRWSLKNEESKKTELMASPEAAMADFDAFQGEFSNSAPTMVTKSLYECAVCLSFTSTRCSRCKAVRYCSSKCQIIHWRQGHKYECHPQGPSASERDDLNENAETVEQCGTNGISSTEDFLKMDDKNISQQRHDDVFDLPVPRLSTVTISSVDTGRSSSGENETLSSHINASTMSQSEDKINTMDMDTSMGLASSGAVNSVKRLKKKSRQDDRRKSRSSNPELSPGLKKDKSDTASSNIPSVKAEEGLFVNNEGQKHSGNSLLQARSSSVSNELSHNGLTSSFQKVAHHFKTPHQKKPPPHDTLLGMSANRNCKTMFQYDAFLKLYSSNEVELKPFGLTNCGNSCYANAVLQCLAYTRPLTMFLLQGFHSKECWKEEWCFICEFEQLMLNGLKGYTPLSPIRILSNISHLGHGREEDAHEFLRYAVDTMQSICAELAGFIGPEREESTIVGMTFGGFLHSKIKCLKCHNKSEKYERMMDLTVEIDGDVRTLEQALRRFTASEMLDGDNKYYCNRCKSYKKAKKKLTIFRAPNILTVVLKRFQAGSFTKLKKPVRFPEILNMAPYMSDLCDIDKYPQYNLYAVVVHLDVSSAEFSGHYVCYVKNYRQEWFKVDDTVVISVDLRRVLSEEAYMLLYARYGFLDTPRPPSSRKNIYGGQSSGLNFGPPPKGRHSSDVSGDPRVRQHQSNKSGYAKDPSFVEEWVTHSVESIPRADSSSEVSSLFSYSEEGTCSTPSTKDSASVDEISDYIFGRGSAARRKKDEVGGKFYKGCIV
ncbi:Ubiquitin carboxyl-terminal hydrolase 17, partial [Bienertia sinuspersici]